MDPRVNVWPEDAPTPEEQPSNVAKLIHELERGIAADLRAAGEPSVWDEIAKVFDEGRTR